MDITPHMLESLQRDAEQEFRADLVAYVRQNFNDLVGSQTEHEIHDLVHSLADLSSECGLTRCDARAVFACLFLDAGGLDCSELPAILIQSNADPDELMLELGSLLEEPERVDLLSQQLAEFGLINEAAELYEEYVEDLEDV